MPPETGFWRRVAPRPGRAAAALAIALGLGTLGGWGIGHVTNGPSTPGPADGPADGPAVGAAPSAERADAAEAESPTVVELAADDMAFDQARLSVAGARPVEIHLDNRDTAPHDVGILGADGEPLYQGEAAAPAGHATYSIDPLDPGSYTFYCTLHPEMTGHLVVT